MEKELRELLDDIDEYLKDRGLLKDENAGRNVSPLWGDSQTRPVESSNEIP